MDSRIFISAAAALVALVVALVALLVLRRRRARRDEDQLAIAPRLEAWVGASAEPRVARDDEPALASQDLRSETVVDSIRTETAPTPVAHEPVSAAPTPLASELASSTAEDFELVAPVEFTIGEDRIPVTDGTETHRRLREYADALLSDLKAARRRTR